MTYFQIVNMKLNSLFSKIDLNNFFTLELGKIEIEKNY